MKAIKLGTWNLELGTLLVLSFFAIACGRSWTPENPGSCVFDTDCFEGWVCVNGRCLDLDLGGEDAGIRLKEFGEPCEDNMECKSDYCLAHTTGGFCTRLCAEGCPSGFVCKRVPDPHGGTERIGLCALDRNRLCKECTEDLDCNPTGSDLCMPVGDGTYCLMDCWYTTCPAGYDCVDVTAGAGALRQCQPAALVCSCTEETAGMLRGCQRENQLGVCSGYEECLPPEGWTDCSAREPAEEECNGIDDECDGRVDEDLVGESCSRSNQYGTCDGEEVCRGFEGWVCGAPEPALEDCDLVDNDCDLETDEDFRDALGRYTDDAHCGGCGVDCAQMIPHATAAECRLVDDQPVCRATECESGYFVYAEGLACLALPANLCRVCSSDEDCLAPGSLCIENGTEHYCGRDCSPSSPYGPGCPAGYACRPYQTAMQCQPESDTCLCTAETVGTARSCLVDTCTGYQECRQNGTLFEWTDCNIEDFNTEICDGEDNNCDGQIDEGYLNPLTGKYDSNEHCGFCNNDCSKYWSEPIDHTNGICQVPSQGMPMCVMGPCSTETEDGITYEWVDVNLDPDDGCECRRVQGNLDTDPPDLIEYPQPGLTYLDENCDGIDGVIADALFVRAGADAPGDGSLASPYPTINQALIAFDSSGKSYILVAEGTYDESVSIFDAQLHGGYSADFLSRDVALYQSIIEAQHSDYAVKMEGPQDFGELISGFVIRGRDVLEAPAPNSNGTPSVAVLIMNGDSSKRIRSNVIIAGRAGDGARGDSGGAGYGRQDSAELDGGAGRNGQRRSGACAAGTSRAGGAGGNNPGCTGTGGNPGGSTVCPVFDWSADPVRGNQAEYTSSAGGNGLGGYDWSFDEKSGSTCSHATESGFPSDHQLNVGNDGRDGADGANGLGGAGGAGRYGSIDGEAWVPSPEVADRGTNGTAGGGAGGGGGGGGTARWYNNWGDCDGYEIGPSGGGGGAGGCGGGGGRPGRAGGASIAIFVLGGIAEPTIHYNLIERGQGGAGGDGGFGGMGGLGGVGGFGGQPPDWISSLGGSGGDGGNGGPGGGGGGGAGGPSYGVLGFDASVAGYTSENTFVYDDTVPTAGAGGAGGGSVGVGASGGAGVAGPYGNMLELITCPAGGCPSGTSCDSNNVCIPD